MNRFVNTLKWDIVRQFREGFYTVSAVVAVIMIVLLRQIDGVDWALWWPAILLENLIINAFYFMAGMVLLEKGEGTLEAQIVSPLRTWEYMAAKVASLLILSILESLLIIGLVSGLRFNWFWLLLGIALVVALYVLYGFFVVARYDSISDFILPSALWTMGFSLPLIWYFDLWKHWIMFLHPLQAPLLLMRAAYYPAEPWQLLYGVGYAGLWVAVGYFVSKRAFHRFVVAKEGSRKS